MAIEVTVIIPTRNRWRLLERTLAGALGQKDVEFEAIVVDDCSTDHTRLGLSRVDDSRLRVLRQSERRGVSAARNRALADASGTWVAFLDDDDLWAPTKLRTLLDVAAACPTAGWAYSGAVVVNELLDVLQVAPPPAPETIAADLLTRNAVPGGCSNVMARTQLVRDVGGFDIELALLADWDLWIRLALVAPAVASPDPLVAYLRHPGSMVRGGQEDVLREVDRLVGKYRAQAAAYGVEPDLRGLYRYFARAHRRAGRRVPASRMYGRIAVGYRSTGDVLRAVGVLFGERVLRTGAWAKRRPPQSTRLHLLGRPPWLDAYLQEAGEAEPAEAARVAGTQAQ